MVRQVLQEVELLNEASAREVLELEKLDIGKMVEERNKKLGRKSVQPGLYGGPVESDPELQTLLREQRSINHRPAPSLFHSLSSIFSV